MATYGISLYGATFYGSFSPEAFRVGRFDAKAQGYDRIALDWENPPAGDWDQLRLVRSSYGHPMSVTEGVTLFTDPAETARVNFTDTGPLTQGRFYYYTLFIRETLGGAWVVAGAQTELVPKDYSSGERMWELLPQMYRDADEHAPRHDTVSTGPLYRFMKLFGYEIDRLRTETDTLLDVTNVDRIAGGLLPLLTDMIGVGYEPELGQRASRGLAKNFIHLVKLKGTKPGIEGAVSAYTGFGATAYVGKNQMLDYNDSEFRESVGHWTALQNVTLERVLEADYSPPIPQMNTMRMTAGAAATDAIALCGSRAPLTLIPVSEDEEWTVSGYFSTPVASPARSVQIGVVFYDFDGTALLTIDSDPVTETPGAWVRPELTLTAPAGASWAGVRAVVVTPADTEEHHLAAVQFERTETTADLRFFELVGSFDDQTGSFETWGNYT